MALWRFLADFWDLGAICDDSGSAVLDSPCLMHMSGAGMTSVDLLQQWNVNLDGGMGIVEFSCGIGIAESGS